MDSKEIAALIVSLIRMYMLILGIYYIIAGVKRSDYHLIAGGSILLFNSSIWK